MVRRELKSKSDITKRVIRFLKEVNKHVSTCKKVNCPIELLVWQNKGQFEEIMKLINELFRGLLNKTWIDIISVAQSETSLDEYFTETY